MNSYIRRDAERIRSLADADVRWQDGHLEPIYLIYAVLMRAKGSAVTAQDVHDAWAAATEIAGDSDPLLIPFGELDEAARDRDTRFVRAIRRAATESIPS